MFMINNAQFGRTDTERSVYSQMQGAGLLDNGQITAANELTAAKIRQNIELGKSIDLEKSFASTFVHDMAAGKSAVEALGDALNNLGSKLIDNGIDQLFAGLNKGTGGASAGGGIASLFGFASGGVMVPGQGPSSLPKFANGGVSRSAAIFGEAGPEAAVPLPDGRRIPVDLRAPSAAKASSSQAVSVVVAPVFNVQNGTADGIEKLKGEIAKSLPSMVTKAMHQAFDRNARFARSGL